MILTVKHSELGPSSAHRWMRCPGSVDFTQNIKRTTEYAKEGSVAHELAASALNGEHVPPSDLEPFKEHIEKYTCYVAGLGTKIEVEKRVDLSNFMPPLGRHSGCVGTVDAIVEGSEKNIVDLKYGFSPVEAEENEQLMLYAIGAYGTEHDVRLHIYQPRIKNISSWLVSAKQLEVFKGRAAYLYKRVASGLESNSFNPGFKQCQFCAGLGKCRAAYNYTIKTVGDIKVNNLNPDDYSELLTRAPLVKKFLEAAEQEAKEQMLQGNPIPGFKVVEGRKGFRKWETKLLQTLAVKLKEMGYKHGQIYETKLFSPAKMQKSVSKVDWQREISQFVDTPKAGKPTVVSDRDKRQAIVTADDFEDLD